MWPAFYYAFNAMYFERDMPKAGHWAEVAAQRHPGNAAALRLGGQWQGNAAVWQGERQLCCASGAQRVAGVTCTQQNLRTRGRSRRCGSPHQSGCGLAIAAV